MAKTTAGRLIERRLRASSLGVNGRDLGDALRRVFGSREEIEEMFGEWEILLTKTIHDASERAKRRRRDRELVPCEDYLPTTVFSVEPLVKLR